MCFSATASFTAASLLSVIGIASIRSIKTKKYTLAAMIPLLFGIQQFCEGLVWVSLNYDWPQNLIHFFSYSFLFFAYIIWPCWIPLSLYFLEIDKSKKNIFIGLFLLGISLALFLTCTLYAYGITPAIGNNHIVYNTNDYTKIATIVSSCIYMFTTILPFFILTDYFFKIFGLLLLISALISFYLWQIAFTSTWCFFSAILSGFMYILVSSKSLPHKSTE